MPEAFDKAWGVVKDESSNLDGVIGRLLSNYDSNDAPLHVNDEYWTLADLFVRQHLNNGDDGFGMKDVEEMYHLICDNKQLLIENNMLNEHGRNNFGFPLWENHDFDKYREQSEQFDAEGERE